jgi:cob(I)alamin adenosyltransferase
LVTGRGDDGGTDLPSGGRVSKHDPRIEAFGDLDELNSFLGACLHDLRSERTATLLDRIQRELFRIAAGLVPIDDARPDAVSSSDTDALDAWIVELEGAIPPSGFVLPGSTPSSARLDMARTVCRRAERRIVALSREFAVPAPLLRYMNRLSSLLFSMARLEERMDGKLRYL